jgi:hypothetical protein
LRKIIEARFVVFSFTGAISDVFGPIRHARHIPVRMWRRFWGRCGEQRPQTFERFVLFVVVVVFL